MRFVLVGVSAAVAVLLAVWPAAQPARRHSPPRGAEPGAWAWLVTLFHMFTGKYLYDVVVSSRRGGGAKAE